MPQVRSLVALSRSGTSDPTLIVRPPDAVAAPDRRIAPPPDENDPTLIWRPPGAVATPDRRIAPKPAARVRCASEPVEVRAADDAQRDRLIGAQLGNYRVIRKLAEGGMGVVYEVQHCTIERRAVVKVMHREFAENADFIARFLNEARAVNIIGHPSLVEVFDYGQRPDGTLFIVMEFLHGKSLQVRLDDPSRPLSEAEVLHLAIQLAHALSAVHGKGIIHRDLKPENIMLVPDPVTQKLTRVKIIDFGIAKVGGRPSSGPKDAAQGTLSGTSLGTPMYMAPEQFGHAKTVDGRADIFALGVILYQLLAGGLPYAGTSLDLLTRRASPLSTRAPCVTPRLAALVHRMISASAAARPLMAEVLNQLVELRASATAAARPDLKRWHRLAVAVAGALVLLNIALILMLAAKPPSTFAPSNPPSRQPSLLPSSQPGPRPSSQPGPRPSPQPGPQPSPRPGSQPSLPSSSQPSLRPSLSPPSLGRIKFETERGVSVKIDRGAWHAHGGKVVELEPGVHRIYYLGGKEKVQVTANCTTTVKIPVTYSQQLSHECWAALSAHRQDKAQRLCSRLRQREQQATSSSLLPRAH